MAVATALQRSSLIGLALPFGRVLPIPSKVTTSGGQQSLVYAYAALDSDTPPTPEPPRADEYRPPRASVVVPRVRLPHEVPAYARARWRAERLSSRGSRASVESVITIGGPVAVPVLDVDARIETRLNGHAVATMDAAIGAGFVAEGAAQIDALVVLSAHVATPAPGVTWQVRHEAVSLLRRISVEQLIDLAFDVDDLDV